jgi:hypothetical protein
LLAHNSILPAFGFGIAVRGAVALTALTWGKPHRPFVPQHAAFSQGVCALHVPVGRPLASRAWESTLASFDNVTSNAAKGFAKFKATRLIKTIARKE